MTEMLRTYTGRLLQFEPTNALIYDSCKAIPALRIPGG